LGVASLVHGAHAGIAVDRDAASIAAALGRLRDQYEPFARRARLLAQEKFDVRCFLSAYRELYEEVADRRVSIRHAASRGDRVMRSAIASVMSGAPAGRGERGRLS
jgi:hypothetical protein